MSSSPNRCSFILLAGLLLLAMLIFWPLNHGTAEALNTITFISPLPVTPVVETHRLTFSSIQQPLTTTSSLTPTLPHDLLLVNERGFMRWRHAARRLETIVDTTVGVSAEQRTVMSLATTVVTATLDQEPWRVVNYKVSQDQHQVLVAYGMGIVGEGGTYHLARYESATAQLTTLLTTTYSISDFMIAPDSSWVAYLLRDTYARHPWWRNLFHSHACGCEEIYLATVYLLRLQPPYTPQPLQICGRDSNGMGECGGLVPLLSDQTGFVWQDGAGYWLADPATGAVRFLADYSRPAIALPDPHLGAKLSPVSPYAISLIAEPAALSFGLFNRQSWEVMKLPEQSSRSVYSGSLRFLPNGDLLWVKRTGGGMVLESWRLNEGYGGTPTRRMIWQLPLTTRNYAIETTVLSGELSGAKIGLSLERPARSGQTAAGLYWIDLSQGQLIKVNRLPVHAEPPDVAVADTIEWAPDGSGALYIDDTAIVGRSAVTYVPADGSLLQSFGTVFGQQPEQITWLLPTAR